MMTLVEHLNELRRRLIICIIAVCAASMGAYFFSDQIIAVVMKPLEATESRCYFFAPADAFMVKLNMSLAAGFVLGFPVVATQCWLFVRPALYRHERTFLVTLIVLACVSFATGVVFAYYAMVPFTLSFFLSFKTPLLEPLISVKEYLSFVAGMLISCGVLFNVPLASAALTTMGVVNHRLLARSRGIGVVIIFVIAAIVTPPDVVSQLIVAFPLWALFEISIVVSWLLRKKQA